MLITPLLRSKHDDVVPCDDSVELVKNGGLPAPVLNEVDSDHWLSDQQSLAAMLAACGR